MTFSLFNTVFLHIYCRLPLLLHSIAWSSVLAIVVGAVSFPPEFAFVSSINANSDFTKACGADGLSRVPIDVPSEILCLPDHLFRKTRMDAFMPPLFSAIMVGLSVGIMRVIALCLDADEEDDYHDYDF